MAPGFRISSTTAETVGVDVGVGVSVRFGVSVGFGRGVCVGCGVRVGCGVLVGAIWGEALLPQAGTTKVRSITTRSSRHSLEVSNIVPSVTRFADC